MFGIALSSGSAIAVGSYGSVYRFNLSAFGLRKVVSVQLLNKVSAPDVMLAKNSSESTDVFGFISSTTPPDFAWKQRSNMVDVFVKTSYIDPANEVNIEFKRSAGYNTLTSENVDVPNEARNLLGDFILVEAYKLKQVVIPFSLRESVRNQAAKLGLTSVRQ